MAPTTGFWRQGAPAPRVFRGQKKTPKTESGGEQAVPHRRGTSGAVPGPSPPRRRSPPAHHSNFTPTPGSVFGGGRWRRRCPGDHCSPLAPRSHQLAALGRKCLGGSPTVGDLGIPPRQLRATPRQSPPFPGGSMRLRGTITFISGGTVSTTSALLAKACSNSTYRPRHGALRLSSHLPAAPFPPPCCAWSHQPPKDPVVQSPPHKTCKETSIAPKIFLGTWGACVSRGRTRYQDEGPRLTPVHLGPTHAPTQSRPTSVPLPFSLTRYDNSGHS
ncbi:hypothetical protein GWK47_054225 [Chionoecetes opilio]|uniref:Uncharacterized protein n=1 Tax=Chionoecetes opilio TaxID=41210 RepID=A0A8J4XZ06_CHIOP|nr:hypothetical protein GWK47_054225 [Chionoecetes opilio]